MQYEFTTWFYCIWKIWRLQESSVISLERLLFCKFWCIDCVSRVNINSICIGLEIFEQDALISPHRVTEESSVRLWSCIQSEPVMHDSGHILIPIPIPAFYKFQEHQVLTMSSATGDSCSTLHENEWCYGVTGWMKCLYECLYDVWKCQLEVSLSGM